MSKSVARTITRLFRGEGREAVLMLRNGVMAMAHLSGGAFDIFIHRRGSQHRKVAAQISADGGHLPTGSRSQDAGLLHDLLKMSQEVWHGQRVHSCPPDARRMRIYQRIAQRAGVATEARHFGNGAGGWLEFTF